MTKMRKPAMLLAGAILLAGISPSAAGSVFAAADTGTAGASAWNSQSAVSSEHQGQGTTVQELRLKLGSREAEINGKKETILRSPYLSGGVVMVPLGVFSAAFGAQTGLGDGSTVRVTLGERAVSLTIGSPVMWTAQGKILAAASPALVNGVLTVPLRQVAEGLGARLSAGSNGEIIVSRIGSAADTSGEDSGEEAGRVGSSVYGWSIDNPGEQIPDSPGQESYTSFSGPEGSYYLQVHVLTNQAEQDGDSLLDNLAEDVLANGNLILSEAVVDAKDGSAPYASVIFTDDTSGGMEETRAYYKDNKIYLVYLTLLNAASYRDFERYNALLDSFEPSFDAADPSLEDLSLSSDEGNLVFAFEDSYNISLRLPSGWEQGDDPADFNGPNGEHIHFSVSSSPTGLTPEGWAGMLKQKLGKTYVADAYHEQGSVQAQWSGEQGLVVKSQINTGSGWADLYQAVLIKDGYRYLMQYKGAVGDSKGKETGTGDLAAPANPVDPAQSSNPANLAEQDKSDDPAGLGDPADSAEPTSLSDLSGPTDSSAVTNASAVSDDPAFNQLLDSVEIPFAAIEDSFGHLEDPSLESDLTQTVTKTSEPYHFTLKLPRYWRSLPASTDSSSAKYDFPGGSFKLSAVKTDEPELYLGDLRSSYTSASGSLGITLTSTENATIAGVPAVIFNIRQQLDAAGGTVTKRVVAFDRKGIFYTLTFVLNDANATDAQKAAMSGVEKSFAFVE